MPILLKARLSLLTSEASIALIAAVLAPTALWLGVLLVLGIPRGVSASASASLARCVLDLAGPAARSNGCFHHGTGALSDRLRWRRSCNFKLIPAYSLQYFADEGWILQMSMQDIGHVVILNAPHALDTAQTGHTEVAGSASRCECKHVVILGKDVDKATRHNALQGGPGASIAGNRGTHQDDRVDQAI